MLDLEPWLMVFIAVMYLALLFILNSILYRPLLRHMDERDRSIAKDLASAKELDDSSKTILEEANEILSKAKAEASTIRQKAIEEAKRLSEAKISLKMREIEEEYERFSNELKTEKENVYNTLLGQLPLYKESLKAKFTQL